MSSKNEYTLKEAIEKLVEQYRLGTKLSEVNLVNRWEKLMGKTIASRTESIKIVDERLIIKVNSASLRQELSQAKAKVIELVNKDAGKEIIKDVFLK